MSYKFLIVTMNVNRLYNNDLLEIAVVTCAVYNSQSIVWFI